MTSPDAGSLGSFAAASATADAAASAFFFTVPGAPTAKGRARVTKFGAHTPVKTRNAEAFVKALAYDAMKGRPLLEGPLAVEIFIYMPIPKSTPKKRYHALVDAPHTKKPDIDNLVKLVKDAMNGVVYHDDAQVFSLTAVKRYGTEPRTVIKVKNVKGENNVRGGSW